MKLKKLLVSALIICLAFCLVACGGEKEEETPVLIMATNAEFPPYEYYENGAIVGIDAEIAAAIADKLGMELQIEDMLFDSIIPAVQVIIVKEGSPIVSCDTLFEGGYTIGVQQATTGDLYTTWDLEDYDLATIDRYNKGADAVQALITGKVDCVVIDNEVAKAFVAANADAGLTILDTEYATEEYAIAMQKGDTELQAAVTKALGELIADGTVQGIIDKYITD